MPLSTGVFRVVVHSGSRARDSPNPLLGKSPKAPPPAPTERRTGQPVWDTNPAQHGPTTGLLLLLSSAQPPLVPLHSLHCSTRPDRTSNPRARTFLCRSCTFRPSIALLLLLIYLRCCSCRLAASNERAALPTSASRSVVTSNRTSVLSTQRT